MAFLISLKGPFKKKTFGNPGLEYIQQDTYYTTNNKLNFEYN